MKDPQKRDAWLPNLGTKKDSVRVSHTGLALPDTRQLPDRQTQRIPDPGRGGVARLVLQCCVLGLQGCDPVFVGAEFRSLLSDQG